MVYSLALSLVHLYKIVSAWGGHRRTAKWRALLAGAIAGPSMLLTGNTQYISLTIYILMCAAVLASRCGIKNEATPHFPSSSFLIHIRVSYVERLYTRPSLPCTYYCLCMYVIPKHNSSRIVYLNNEPRSAYILKQDSLHPSYKSFLNKHGGKAAGCERPGMWELSSELGSNRESLQVQCAVSLLGYGHVFSSGCSRGACNIPMVALGTL
ncbi:hypothetical protein HAX54_018597 [Datura stramonium]|uniref:Mannosyltransferase n=1 Tax=Datura stramonium TaxID=4076 RepID=A0ABS8UP99_DATST|nr:hypothetical protein [Datura stramonium]